jgi:hypothetical protein
MGNIIMKVTETKHRPINTNGKDAFSLQHECLPFTKKQLKTKLCGLSPQASYTNRMTAACRKS